MSAQKKLTVSVIIPTYNRAGFLSDAIQSVLQQTRPITELIVVDDGSTDETSALVNGFGGKVRYVYQENSGPAAARNLGMQLATGDFIAFQDSDDLWVENKIELQLELIANHPQLEFVFGDMANFRGKEQSLSPEIKNEELHNYLGRENSNLQKLFEWLVVENVIPTGTVLFKRNIIEKVGYFDESLQLAEDYKYWLQISASCVAGFIPKVLLLRRRHQHNLVNNWTERNLAIIRVLEETGIPLASSKKEILESITTKIQEIRYDLGSHFFKDGHFDKTLEHLQYATPKGLQKISWALKMLIARTLKPTSPR